MSDSTPELSTTRLFLRSPKPEDGQAVYEAIAESLDSLRRWPASLPWALHAPSPEASKRFCEQSIQDASNRTGFTFLIFHQEGRLLGCVGLHHIHWAIPKFEIGFWLRTSAQRQGYATEAIQAVLGFAFEQLQAKRVEARTDEDNRACRRTCESAGLELKGILRNERMTPMGVVKNTCVYAIIPA